MHRTIHSKSPIRPVLSAFCIATLALSTVTFAAAQSEKIIRVFVNVGRDPSGGLVADSHGMLYGSTSGDVFKLGPPRSNTWPETILYSFTGNDDGGNPAGSLLMNRTTGKIYGATSFGGANSGGVVYELTPGNPWTQTVLHAFKGPDGLHPNGLSMFYKGWLVGTTENGGANHAGVVFALSPPSLPGDPYTGKVLHAFDLDSEGCCPVPGLVADQNGALYGTTFDHGPGFHGTVYKLTPPSGSGEWTLTTLYAFSGGADGANPAAVVFGSDGALYGSTLFGGGFGVGTIFQLTPPSGGTGSWTLTTLYAFTGGADGSVPSDLVVDSTGTLYGGAYGGGDLTCEGKIGGCGTIFKLTPPASPGGSWTQSVLYAFQGTAHNHEDGSSPIGRLVLLNNKIYGVTVDGGRRWNPGIAFELTP